MTTITPTKKQQKLITAFTHKGKSLVIDSLAGTGKTTLAYMIAQKNPMRRFLLLTSSLAEHATHIKLIPTNNIIAESLPNIIKKVYGITVLEGISSSPLQLQATPTKYDTLIIDEAHNLSHISFAWVKRLIKDLNIGDDNSRVIILGDSQQTVPETDVRFLTNAKAVFSSGLKSATLNEIHGLSRRLVKFMIGGLIGDNIPEIKNPTTPNESFNKKKQTTMYVYDTTLTEDLIKIIQKLGGPNSQIIVPSRQYAIDNLQYLAGLSHIVPVSDIKGHGEAMYSRAVTFFIGMEDVTYPHEYYLAISRAGEQLIIFQDKNRPFPGFISMKYFLEHVTVKNGLYSKEFLDMNKKHTMDRQPPTIPHLQHFLRQGVIPIYTDFVHPIRLRAPILSPSFRDEMNTLTQYIGDIPFKIWTGDILTATCVYSYILKHRTYLLNPTNFSWGNIEPRHISNVAINNHREFAIRKVIIKDPTAITNHITKQDINTVADRIHHIINDYVDVECLNNITFNNTTIFNDKFSLLITTTDIIADIDILHTALKDDTTTLRFIYNPFTDELLNVPELSEPAKKYMIDNLTTDRQMAPTYLLPHGTNDFIKLVNL